MENEIDNTVQNNLARRRRFLRLFGTAAALLPISAITGCSDDQAPASASEPQTPDAEPLAQPSQPAEQQPAPQEATESASEQAAEELEKVSLDNPTAKALGYQHDAANVDLQKYPQRGTEDAANQYCRNCSLFTGGEGEGWGRCALFPGNLVNANGWCSGYTPKAT